MKENNSRMLIKHLVAKKLVVDLALPEKVIISVIDHQFKSILNAMKTCNTIEMSGFGKFFFNATRANMRMKKYENQRNLYSKWMLSDDVQKQKMGEVRYKETLIDEERVKNFLHEHKKDI